MKQLRKLLLPFSLIYLLITAIRNVLYNKEIFKSAKFKIPVIAIGNLSTGGTGKSPQTEYLIRLLSHNYQVATLSRGYKRKSEGFVLAGRGSNADVLGDEPYQFYNKFPDIYVAVDVDRKNGIEQLLRLTPKPDVIILDDAYQHRRVKAGFYILLTAYNDLYIDDYVLPAGNLRESREGAKRADVIIVTKCPLGLSNSEQEGIKRELRPQSYQKVYFTAIDYDSVIYGSNGVQMYTENVKSIEKVLVAGIAKPEPFFNHLRNDKDTCLTYPDHHDFSEKDIKDIKEKAGGRIIITTEKDYVRLKDKLAYDKLFYLPIKTSFLSKASDFDKTVMEYIERLSLY